MNRSRRTAGATPEPASESRRLGEHAPRHLRAHGRGLHPPHRRLRRRGRSRTLHPPGRAVGLELGRASWTPAVARAATPPCSGWPAPKSSASIWPGPCCVRPGGSMTARTSVRVTCGACPSPRTPSTPSGASPPSATCRPLPFPMRSPNSGASSTAAGSTSSSAKELRRPHRLPGKAALPRYFTDLTAGLPGRLPSTPPASPSTNRTPGPPPTKPPGSTPSPGASDPLSRSARPRRARRAG